MIDERKPKEKHPIAKAAAPTEVEQVSGQAVEPAEDALLTKEVFVAQAQQLLEQARAAGLKPIQMMTQTYAKRGMAILEGLLASLGNEDSSKKKKE